MQLIAKVRFSRLWFLMTIIFCALCIVLFIESVKASTPQEIQQWHDSEFQKYNRLAEQGDADAQIEIGNIYRFGTGVITDNIKALKWYRFAAAQGNAKAQFLVGDFYHFGMGTAQNYIEAVRWYRLAAAQGNTGAQIQLGVMYQAGLGVTKDYVEAVRWYRLSDSSGANFILEKSFDFGETSYNRQDYTKAINCYGIAAVQGNATAQNKIGDMYYNGQGVTQDYAEAVKWYRLAATQGYKDAQDNLGHMYEKGNGVTQDYVEALKWYRLAATQGDDSAQFAIGLIYYWGQGVTQDYAESLRWFRLAAAQGNAKAQCCIGICYYQGQGVTQDYAEAFKWYRLAAAQGQKDAQANLKLFTPQILTNIKIAQIEALRVSRQQESDMATKAIHSQGAKRQSYKTASNRYNLETIQHNGMIAALDQELNRIQQEQIAAAQETQRRIAREAQEKKESASEDYRKSIFNYQMIQIQKKMSKPF